MDGSTMTAYEDQSDNDYTPSLLSDLTNIEVECKLEPPDEVIEDLPYDDVPFHIPVFAPKIKNPIILLEKCDNIWKTLQLIKTVQPEITPNEDYSEEEEKEKTHEEEEKEEEKEEEEERQEKQEEEEEEEETKKHLHETLRSAYVRRQATKRNENTVLPPFKFSVQSTRKVYPCLTCGKHYMERRSLRRHLWKMHGVLLPLIRKRVRTSANSISLQSTSSIPTSSGPTSTKPTSSKPTTTKPTNSKPTTSKLTSSKSIYSKLTDKKVTSDILLKKENNSESHDESGTVAKKPCAMDSYVKCPLCKRKVSCLKKHYICYHKIGGKSSLMQQLESSSVASENKVNQTPKKKSSLSNILSGKSQTSSTQDIRNSFRLMDNEETIPVTKKRKYTLSQENKEKKPKIDKSLTHNEHKRRITQSINCPSYKCQICFGLYASRHGLYKHQRIHKLRGETQENFHNFKCRYLNSPLNQRFQSPSHLQSSSKLSIITKKNNSSSVKRSVQPSNSKKNQLSPRKKTLNRNTNTVNSNPSGRNMPKNTKTTCSCGRSFRNPHTLFIHKEQCNFDALETKRAQSTRKRSYDDKDLGNGISIKIKKRNDSYEIVGKDTDEDRSGKSVQMENSLSIATKSSDHITKDAANTSTKPEVDTAKRPEYSKDHSIMKIKIADEDLVVDIEDDVAVNADKTVTTVEQVNAPECDKEYLSQHQDQTSDEKDTNTKVPDEMSKQLHENVGEILAECRVKNTLEDKKVLKDKVQENSQIKEQKSSSVKSQEIYQENKMELRSRKRSQSTSNFENYDDTFGTEFDRPQLYMTKPDSLKCGYCNEKFGTTNSYDNHQCTVKEGKPFNDFSLYLPCFYCSEVLNTYQEYDQHMRIKHLDEMYNCYQCPERFRHEKARLNHLQNYHDDMSCRVCNKKMNTSTKILHEGYHFGFGFPCHKCKKAYTSKKNLCYHRTTIHPVGGDNLITCSICLKSIKLKTFRGHMSTHKHNECHFCGKMFSNRTGIEYHTMIYHGTQSKLKCNVSGTRFINKNQLDKHEKKGACRNNGKKVNPRSVYYTNARNY